MLKLVIKIVILTGLAFMQCEGNNEKCPEKIDLGLMLDSSGSISTSNFDRMKNFVKNLTSYFVLSHDQTRVSVMTFSSNPEIHIRFNQKFSRYEFNREVDSIAYYGGGTNIAKALNKASNGMFTESSGARNSDGTKVLVILTDGYGGFVSGPAQKLQNAGVVIFSVGIGDSVSEQNLRDVASYPKDEHLYLLANFSQLSTLAQQMSSKVCNASHFQVFCTSNEMQVIFRRNKLPKHITPNNFQLKEFTDSRCKVAGNETHVYVKVPLNGCGTIYSETDLAISFTNSLKETENYTSSGAVISREKLYEAEFTCTYGRKRTVGSISFEPSKNTTKIVKSANGNFSLTLDFFPSESYSVKYTEDNYPVFKELTDNIYIQYSINSTNKDLVVHAEECRATATNKPYDNPQYVFISDGCDKDKTIRHFGQGVASIRRFSIQAFRFLTQHRFVYIHCDLVVCNRQRSNSTCARGDLCSRRTRRDVNAGTSQDDPSQTYSLSLGPLMSTGKPGTTEAGEPNQPFDKTVLVVSLAGVACLALILVGLVVLGVRKYRSLKSKPAAKSQDMSLEPQQQREKNNLGYSSD